MKLFALLVMYKDDPPTRLKGAFDVSSFSFFQRSSVQGTLLFINRVLVSLGAVGAVTPTDLKESFQPKVLYIQFGANLKICTHSFEVLNRTLIDLGSIERVLYFGQP